jgi:hypothetical protein
MIVEKKLVAPKRRARVEVQQLVTELASSGMRAGKAWPQSSHAKYRPTMVSTGIPFERRLGYYMAAVGKVWVSALNLLKSA